MSQPKTRGTSIRCFRAGDDFWAEVKAHASDEGVHVSDLIRGLLREWLDTKND